MKTVKNWFGRVENLALVAGSLFFIIAMVYFVSLFEKATPGVSMIYYFVTSAIFFYLAIDYSRKSDRILQEKKFSWGLCIFGLVVMITASVCGLLFYSMFGKTVEWIVKSIFVVFSTVGVIVFVHALKRVHVKSKKGGKT